VKRCRMCDTISPRTMAYLGREFTTMRSTPPRSCAFEPRSFFSEIYRIMVESRSDVGGMMLAKWRVCPSFIVLTLLGSKPHPPNQTNLISKASGLILHMETHIPRGPNPAYADQNGFIRGFTEPEEIEEHNIQNALANHRTAMFVINHKKRAVPECA
jgi:hypothetical protein